MPHYVKVGSHRARAKLKQIMGQESQSYYHWEKEGEWHDVGCLPDEYRDKILATKGLSIPASVPNDLRPHHKWA